MSSQPGTGKKAMASEDNSEGREATRSILQDVCSDFETMNVVAPRTNKVGVIRSLRTRNSTPQKPVQRHPVTNVQRGKDPPSSTSVIKTSPPAANKEVTHTNLTTSDASSNRSVLISNVVSMKSSTVTNSLPASEVQQGENELNKIAETSIALGTEYLQPSASSSVTPVITELLQPTGLNTESNVHINSELLPLNSSQETSHIAVMPESFAVDTNLSSLAQLADAEIVQSGDNVSIIVSNPRFIEVLTNAGLESGTVIQTPSSVLDTSIGPTQQIELIDPSFLTDSTLQNVTIADDLNFIQEEVASARSSSSKSSTQTNTKSPKKEGRARGRPPKSASALRKSAESPPPSYIPSTPFSRGRRVTARMKAAWTKLLEMDGRLVCQMPGCSQKFVTVANFQTHFKYCSGKKTLVKCDYCDSMIFSTHKAILQHMEVEHPEKADEYRAAHQEEILEFEKNNAPDHLIIAEDENVAMNVEEVTQKSNISRKRKLSEKESAVPNKKVILKHKLQSIQNSMAENTKEFKKCVRFDSITDAINSVKMSSLEEACRISEATPVKTRTDRRIKNVFNEKIVAADKYFEDDEDVDQPQTQEEDQLQKEKEDERERMHTKARLMLNLERYKRYQEYLTVTRDWSSERRTYSRPRGSDVSAENSFNTQMLHESFQDIHQLNYMTESSDISLNTPEAEINSIQLPSVETYQVVETPQYVSAVSLQPEPGEPDVLTSTPKDVNSLNISPCELDHHLMYGENRVRRETCYNRVNFETPKQKPRLGGIITYGVKVPDENANKSDKSVEPPVTFDSLVNFMKPKTARRNSQVENIENIPKPIKEEIVKLSNGKDVAKKKISKESPKMSPKKRGRPPKPKIESPVDSKVAKSPQKAVKAQKGRAKKYSAAMLKTIERNVKNKKISRLFGIKKKMKSKKYASMQSKNINLKNIRLKQLKNNLIAKKIKDKKKKHSKTKTVDVSAIQCQENIDNHLNIGQGINISDVALHSHITSDRSYTSTLNQLLVDANIAGEIEIAATNIEQVLETVADANKAENLPENVANENASSEQINKEIESANIPDLSKITSQVAEEISSLNETETDIVDKEKINDGKNDQTEIRHSEKPSDSLELVQKDKDESPNLLQKDTESNDTSVRPKEKDTESDDTGVKPMEKDTESDDTGVKPMEKDTENDDTGVKPMEKGTESDDTGVKPMEKDTESDDTDVKPMEKDTESDDTGVKPMEKDTESNDTGIKPMEKDIESNDTGVKSVENNLENNDKSVDLSSVHDNQLESTSSDKQLPATPEDAVKEQLNNNNATLNDLNTNNVESAPEAHEVQQSYTNKEVEDTPPEVPVKRGRGRPRKDSKKTVPKVSKAKKSTGKDRGSEEPKVIDDNAKTCDEVKDNSVVSETSMLDNSVADDNKAVPDDNKKVPDDNKTVPVVRKSERVRRRKLVDDEVLQTPTAETKQKEATPTTTPVLEATPTTTPVLEVTPQSKRRGRPRKNQIQESPQVTTDKKSEDSQQKTPEIEVIESEVVDENLRKFPRKGRPRKCVRYADLNSGLESSESMDGTHNAVVVGKDKSDSTKEKSPKNVQKTQVLEEVTELPAESKEQEENIVLPLKKRKQRQAKKNDSELEKSKPSKIVDEEILVINEENENKPEENEDDSEKRTLRSRKRGTKRKKAAGSSDEEWDPEVHLKSIGKSTGQKSRAAILELEETSDSSCSEKRDPTFTKKEGDSIRRIATRNLKTKRLDVAAAKYSLKTLKELFMDYKPQRWMWKILSGDDYSLPPMKISPFFKIEKAWEETEAYWSTLNLFDSVPLEKNSCHGTFFTGGPITCSAWCPTPVEKNKVQYVAVAVSSLMNKLHSYICEEPERGFLQLWNVGDLNKNTLQRKPFMEMSICHQYGPVNDMAWCPYGCWEKPEVEDSSDILPRLGLLAVACSDSNIRIYSIPHPHILPKEDTSFPIYSAYPNVVLQPLCGDMCLANKKSVCVTLSWQKSDHCERIAAGYGCGMICIWRVSSSATVLAAKENNQIIIKPYLVFNAHGTPVLGLSFSPLPGGRYLVSASVDKTLKFWDLLDTSLPIYTVKKGAGKCAHWSSYYCGSFGSIQHGMNNYKGSSFFKECGTETISSRALSHPNCSIILSSVSDWLNAIAIGDVVGNVSVSFTHSLIHEHAKGPQYFQRYVYESELKPVEGIAEKIIFSSYPESVNCIEKIQEMKQTSLLLNEIVSSVCERINIEDISYTQKSHSEENCQLALEDVNEVVSIVHHIVENSQSVTLDSEEDSTLDIQQDLMQECNVGDEEVNSDEVVSSKLSSITDIVALVTDINDVTETVDKLICSSQASVSQTVSSSSADDMLSSDTSLMEVDDSEDLCRAEKQSSDVIQSSVEIVQVLDSVMNSVGQNEDSQRIQELSNISEQVVSENVITDIHTEGIACISAMDEMSNVVAVVDSMTERCSMSDVFNISSQTVQAEDNVCILAVNDIKNVLTVMENLTESCSKSAFINEFYAIISEKHEEIHPSHLGIVGCVLQNIKDVIFITEEITNRCCKPLKSGVDLDLNGSEIRQHPLTNNLIVSFNQLTYSRNKYEDDEKHICNRKELPYGLSEIVDVVSTVSDIEDTTDALLSMNDTVEVVSAMKGATEVLSDMKDTTEVLSDMKDTTEVLSDMKDTIEVLSDMKDMTEVLSDMKDTTEVVCALTSITESVLDMKDVVSSSQDLKDVISFAEDLRDVTLITEKLNNEISNSRSSDCVVSFLVNEMVENVSKEKDRESEATRVMNNLISSIQMVIKSINNGNEKSTQNVTGGHDTANKNSVHSSEVTEIEENVIKCDNSLSKNFDYQLHELPDEMDEQMLSADSESSSSDIDTDDEMEVDNSYMFDQDSNLSDDSILSERSLDSAASIYSFSSESDVSVDSEQEIDDLVPSNQNNVADTVKAPSRLSPKLTDLTFEGKIVSSSQNLTVESNSESLVADVSDSTRPSDSSVDLTANVSDSTKPSVISEGLTASVSDSTKPSDVSEGLTASVSDSTKPSDSSEGLTANVLDSTKPSDSSECRTAIVSDSTKPVDSSEGRTVIVSDSTKPVDSSEGRTVIVSDSTKPAESSEGPTIDVSDSTKPSKDCNVEIPVQENNLSVVTDSNVPDSQHIVLSEDKPISETVAKTSSSSTSEVELVCLNSEITTQISDQVEPKTTISSDAMSVDSSNIPDSLDLSNAVSEMPCDNSTCNAETAEMSVDSSTETCIELTENTVVDTDVESLRENLPDNVNSTVLPETVENISKSSEIAELDVVNSEQSVIHENSYTSTEVEPCVVNKKKSPETFTSYEDVISKYGIVFKDMNTAKFDKIEPGNYKELDEYYLNRYNLTAIKTVSWNPNRGSHHWLLSAGQSGIARLSYISDILQPANSDRKAK